MLAGRAEIASLSHLLQSQLHALRTLTLAVHSSRIGCNLHPRLETAARSLAFFAPISARPSSLAIEALDVGRPHAHLSPIIRDSSEHS